MDAEFVDHIARERPELFEQLERGNDASPRTTDPGFRTTGFHAADTVEPRINHIFQSYRRIPAFADKIHHRRDKTAMHEHPRAVPFRIAPDLEDIEPLE